jgi:hypothetical protein
MTKSYHCFYTKSVGYEHKYEAFDREADVVALVKRADNPYDICGLRVVYGELLEFEPATVVETYRIKEPEVRR